MASVTLHPPKADEVTSGEGEIAEAVPSPVKHHVTTEKNARDLTTSNYSSISCVRKTATGKDKEKCSSGNDQQVVSSDTYISKGSSLKNVTSSSLDSGSCDRSDMYEEQARKSEEKHLTIGEKDQEYESTKIARCK